MSRRVMKRKSELDNSLTNEQPTASSAAMVSIAGDEAASPTSDFAADGYCDVHSPSIRANAERTIGQTVLLMMQQPRYREMTLADLEQFLLQPLVADRVAIARALKRPDGGASEAAPVGAAIWASVGEEASAKIAQQIANGEFPVRLAADDWASGDALWLLDIIAPSREEGEALLTEFSKLAGDRPVKVHPVIAASIDPKSFSRLTGLGPAEAEAAQ